MNVKVISDLELDIYLKKEIIKSIDLKNIEELEKYFKRLFKVLKDKYKISIEGFYDINVYIDKYYGVVIHLEKEDLEYYEYFKNQVDMRIVTIDTNFLYEVSDIPECMFNKAIEIINNRIFVKLKSCLDKKDMMKLMEYSTLIYDKEKQLSK